MKRWVGAVFVVVMTACPSHLTNGFPSSDYRGWRVFSGTAGFSGFSFKYPPGFTAHGFNDESSFSTLLTYVSNQRLNNPCVRKYGPRTPGRPAPLVSQACGEPLKTLTPGGFLLTVTANGFPGWSLSEIHGKGLQVAGSAAELTQEFPGDCGAVGADETMVAYIQRMPTDNWFEFRACLRGPGRGHQEQVVKMILASIDLPTNP